jgi:hypothetical protein
MIKQSVFENDLIYGMQRELRGFEKNAAMDKLPKAVNYLQAAMEIFEATGLTVQADKVLNILAKIAGDEQNVQKKKQPSDPHTKGLTPEKQVENLKHHGTVFNMSDDGKADDMLEADVPEEQLEVTEPHHAEKDFEEES